jgi:hypothetical protein
MSSSTSTQPLIHTSAFLRTLLAPLLAWSAAVIALTLSGQPGVVCATPMAWVMAFWCGGQYIRLSEGRPGRWPLFGPALVGSLLGVGMSVLFILVSTLAMPVGNDPVEIAKARNLTIAISAGSILICTLFSMITAWFTLQRYASEQQLPARQDSSR